MSLNRNSESTEQLSARARTLLNQYIRQPLGETNINENINDESLEQISQDDSIYAGRMSVAGARRRLRVEWAELKGDRLSVGAPLAGVVAMVCLKKDDRAIALRSALTALGSTVVLKWSYLVTHLVWEVGADRAVRKNARVLNAHVVSPQWVEACAASCSHVPEMMYATRVRPSDPLDPPTLTRILRKAEKENLPLLEESNSSSDGSNIKLRISESTDTSRNKSTDKSTDTSRNKSTDKSKNKSALTISDESKSKSLDSSLAPSSDTRVNTAPRKMHPISTSPLHPLKSRRKLFTNLEENSDSSEQDLNTQKPKCKNPYGSPRQRKNRQQKMRRDISEIGRINAKENDKLTINESLLRLLLEDPKKQVRPQPMSKPTQSQKLPNSQTNKIKAFIVLSGVSRSERSSLRASALRLGCKVDSVVTSRTTHVVVTSRRRTLASLEGTVRGCWLVTLTFLTDSVEQNCLVDPRRYQVEEFRKTSNKARIERTALQLRKYALQIFASLRIRVDVCVPHAQQLKRLLQLCGATVIDEVCHEENPDITIGRPSQNSSVGVCVVPRWISDSISAGRARSTKLYRTVISTQSTNI